MADVDPIVVRLREVRRLKKLSAASVAQLAGLHYSTICGAERGAHSVSLPVLRVWAEALGVELDARLPRRGRPYRGRRTVRYVLSREVR